MPLNRHILRLLLCTAGLWCHTQAVAQTSSVLPLSFKITTAEFFEENIPVSQRKHYQKIWINNPPSGQVFHDPNPMTVFVSKKVYLTDQDIQKVSIANEGVILQLGAKGTKLLRELTEKYVGHAFAIISPHDHILLGTPIIRGIISEGNMLISNSLNDTPAQTQALANKLHNGKIEFRLMEYAANPTDDFIQKTFEQYSPPAPTRYPIWINTATAISGEDIQQIDIVKYALPSPPPSKFPYPADNKPTTVWTVQLSLRKNAASRWDFEKSYYLIDAKNRLFSLSETTVRKNHQTLLMGFFLKRKEATEFIERLHTPASEAP